MANELLDNLLISDATSADGMGLIELRRIEVSREISTTLARSGNVMYFPNSGSQMLLGLNPSRSVTKLGFSSWVGQNNSSQN